MRWLPIRIKVTLWYTMFMILLVVVILGLLVELSGNLMFMNQKEQLIEAVNDAQEEIAEGDQIDYFEDGVYLLQYDARREYVNGSVPSNFPSSIELDDGGVQTVKENGRIFLYYDRQVVNDFGEVSWIRGVISDSSSNQMTRIILGNAFVLLPILVFLSTTIGYVITKNAFEPIRKIQKTTQQITQSRELSMRIGLPDGKDEISELGKTIDGMLEQLEKSFEKEKQFTADASHELRTPLSVIITESEYMLLHVNDLEEARDSMEVVNRQANKMSALINQLLFFARAESNTIKLQLENVEVPTVVEEIIEDCRGMAEDAEITISMICELKDEGNYDVDKMLFIRAVQNVIVNAIVYGKKDGYVQVSITEESGYFVIEVKDNGIGISKENLEKIWNRFYRVDEARSRQHTSGSMGLGLSMVQWITEKHGGYVEVESTLNEGSTFSLYFPIKKM